MHRSSTVVSPAGGAEADPGSIETTRRRVLAAAVALTAVPLARAWAQEGPTTGGGNFSLFVPTPDLTVRRMLEIAEVRADDYVIDLGCGDGRIVIAAARAFGARGLGVDIDEELVEKSRAAAAAAGVSGRVRFEVGDVLRANLDGATVVTLYLFPELLVVLKPKLLSELAPGARIVVHDFAFPAWEPDASARFYVPEKYLGAGGESRVSLWIVPATVGGRWRLALADRAGSPLDLAVRQRHQMLEIAPATRGGPRVTGGGRLRGAEVAFALRVPGRGGVERWEFDGEVNGPSMSGTVRRGGARAVAWTAHRAGEGAARQT